MKLTKRGNLVVGVTTGAVVALTLQFFFTHHTVIDTKTCKKVDVGTACHFHYERNK